MGTVLKCPYAYSKGANIMVHVDGNTTPLQMSLHVGSTYLNKSPHDVEASAVILLSRSEAEASDDAAIWQIAGLERAMP